MKFSRLLLIVISVTVVALGYVTQKTELMVLSYKLRHLERIRQERLDEHQTLHYNVLALTSPQVLDHELSKYRIDVKMPQGWEFVHASRPVATAVGQGGNDLKGWYRQWWSGLVGRGAQAEAGPMRRDGSTRRPSARPPKADSLRTVPSEVEGRSLTR